MTKKEIKMNEFSVEAFSIRKSNKKAKENLDRATEFYSKISNEELMALRAILQFFVDTEIAAMRNLISKRYFDEDGGIWVDKSEYSAKKSARDFATLEATNLVLNEIKERGKVTNFLEIFRSSVQQIVFWFQDKFEEFSDYHSEDVIDEIRQYTPKPEGKISETKNAFLLNAKNHFEVARKWALRS